MRKQQALRWFVLSLWRASQRWNDAACVDLSAAFAYFTLQSFFPLLLIVLSVAARVLGRTDSLDKLIIFVAQILPPSAVDLVDSTLRGLVAQGFGAGLFGVAVLVITASNAYLTLQRGADRLWSEILPPPSIGFTPFGAGVPVFSCTIGGICDYFINRCPNFNRSSIDWI